MGGGWLELAVFVSSTQKFQPPKYFFFGWKNTCDVSGVSNFPPPVEHVAQEAEAQVREEPDTRRAVGG